MLCSNPLTRCTVRAVLDTGLTSSCRSVAKSRGQAARQNTNRHKDLSRCVFVGGRDISLYKSGQFLCLICTFQILLHPAAEKLICWVDPPFSTLQVFHPCDELVMSWHIFRVFFLFPCFSIFLFTTHLICVVAAIENPLYLLTLKVS